MDRLNDLRLLQPGHRGDLQAPLGLNLRPGLRVGDLLVAGERLGHAADVPCSLHVVLPAEGVYTGPFDPQVSREEREVSEALDIRHTRAVFGNAQGVTDGRPPGGRVLPGHLPDDPCRDAGDRLGPLGGKLLDVLPVLLEPLDPVPEVLFIVESLLDDGVGHGVQQGHVAPDLDREVAGGETDEVNPPGIGDDQLRSLPDGPF